MIFGQILLKWLKKCHFLWSKFLKSANVPLPYYTVYAKNDPDLLYVLYLTCCNMTLHFTLINIVVVLFLLLLLHQTEVVQNVVLFFKKCQNQITSKLSYLEKMVIVSYLSLLVFWFILLFCTVFGKQNVLKTLFQHIFAISDAFFDPIWHKLYYQHKIWSLRTKEYSRQHL